MLISDFRKFFPQSLLTNIYLYNSQEKYIHTGFDILKQRKYFPKNYFKEANSYNVHFRYEFEECHADLELAQFDQVSVWLLRMIVCFLNHCPEHLQILTLKMFYSFSI